MSFSKIFASLLLPLLLFTGCDREEEADRFAAVTIEFEDTNGLPITELSVPYFRMVSESTRSIRSVYRDDESYQLATDSSAFYVDGKAKYSLLAVPGPTESIDIGDNNPVVSFRDAVTDSTLTLPICFPSSVPFTEPTDLVPGRSYVIRIELDLGNTHREGSRFFVEGRGVTANVD